jgi:hypothetical protein
VNHFIISRKAAEELIATFDDLEVNDDDSTFARLHKVEVVFIQELYLALSRGVAESSTRKVAISLGDEASRTLAKEAHNALVFYREQMHELRGFADEQKSARSCRGVFQRLVKYIDSLWRRQ